jgi:hypothetical protein
MRFGVAFAADTDPHADMIKINKKYERSVELVENF